MYNKYPYTDFHELNLDWFLAQFKELVEAWDVQKVDYNQFKLDVTTEFNTLSGKFDKLEETVQTFTTFVENYFENLDVQQEINNKLDAMAADGSLDALLDPLVTSKVPPAVTEWLNENVTPIGSAVVVDNSLSVSGAAADAKVTGDRLTEENEFLNENVNFDALNMPGFQGGATGSGMQQGGYSYIVQTNTNTNRIRTFDITGATLLLTDLIKLQPGKYKISVPAGFKAAPQIWGEDRVGLLVYQFKTDDIMITLTDVGYFGCVIGHTDDSVIDPSEVSNIKLQAWNDIKETAPQKITLPFVFAYSDNIYKEKDKYVTDLKVHDHYNTSASGVTVFINSLGNDANDGLTVLTPKKTISGCLAIPNVNTIVFAGGIYNVGVNFDAGQTIGIDINFIGCGDVVIDNGIGDPITFTSNVFCENIEFRGGINAVICQQSDPDNESVFYRCKFFRSYRYNGLSILGGKALIVECQACFNAYDGFNYHANGAVLANSFEINCKAYENGRYNLAGADGQSSNASTSHDGCPIVRLNGEYYCCHGGIVADKQCSSANYGCSAGVSTVTDNAYPDRKSNYWSSAADMYLIDCSSFGSPYDTAVINGGTITSNIDYPSKYTA